MSEHNFQKPADEAQRDNLTKARESFSGRLLTDAQFSEAIHITEILEREIYKSGRFKDKLSDYSYVSRVCEANTRKSRQAHFVKMCWEAPFSAFLMKRRLSEFAIR